MMLDGGEYAIKHVDMTGEVAESLGMVVAVPWKF